MKLLCVKLQRILYENVQNVLSVVFKGREQSLFRLLTADFYTFTRNLKIQQDK